MCSVNHVIKGYLGGEFVTDSIIICRKEKFGRNRGQLNLFRLTSLLSHSSFASSSSHLVVENLDFRILSPISHTDFRTNLLIIRKKRGREGMRRRMENRGWKRVMESEREQDGGRSDEEWYLAVGVAKSIYIYNLTDVVLACCEIVGGRNCEKVDNGEKKIEKVEVREKKMKNRKKSEKKSEKNEKKRKESEKIFSLDRKKRYFGFFFY